MVFVRSDIQPLFSEMKSVHDFRRLDGHEVRRFKNRFTAVIERGGRRFYLKYHAPPGIGPILEDLAHLRRPSVGAGVEARAIEALHELGVPTMRLAAWGREGRLPPWAHSFVMSDELVNAVDLETLASRWTEKPPPDRFRQHLVRAVARIARRLHEAGINHRDFYLCHFLLDVSAGDWDGALSEPTLYLIDLHRVEQRRRLPRRWRVKDLAGLYFSAMDGPITRRDRLRFIKAYTGLPLRQALRAPGQPPLWHLVNRRAKAMYHKHWAVGPKESR